MASIQLISKPLFVRRSINPIRFIIPFSSYSTHLPKKAAGAFTSNKHINKSENSNLVNKTLVYIGPFSETIRRYKMTASLFGACGICAVPALLSTGEAPTISVMLAGLSAISPSIFIHWYTKEYAASLIAYEDIKIIERQRKKPLEIKDMWLGIETWSFFGVKKEQNMWLSQLFDVSDRKMMKWKYKNHIFAFEHGVMDADPFLKGLVKKMASNNSNRKIEK